MDFLRDQERLAALARYDIMGTPPEAAFDAIARLASRIADCPVAFVGGMDGERQWFKSVLGLDICEVSADISFCQHALGGFGPLIIRDASQDDRVKNNPYVTGEPHLRFYAGFPLRVENGLDLGTLCVMDTKPRDLTFEQIAALADLAEQVVHLLDLRLARKTLIQTEQRFRSAFYEAGSGMFIADWEGRITEVNHALEALLGYDAATLQGRAIPTLVHPDEEGQALVNLARLFTGRTAHSEYDQRFLTADGTEVWTRCVSNLLPGNAADASILVHVQDVTEQRRAEEQLAYQATHDALTGLVNRTVFNQRLDNALSVNAKATAVLFVDVDNFKTINDSLGHKYGDAALVETARRLTQAVRAGDVVARWAGDEFVILAQNLTHPDDVRAVGDRISGLFSEPYVIDGKTVPLGVSVGIALADSRLADEVVTNADSAMLAAKDKGRNQYVFFGPEENAAVRDRNQMVQDLRAAIANDDLVLHYQPYISSELGQAVGAEALVRWPRHGTLVPPGQFIGLAEETGLIVPLGAWVLRTACAQAAQWISAWPSERHFYISVNLSARQIADDSIVDTVRDALAVSGLPANRLWLEVTETALVEDLDRAARVLGSLAELGVGLALDDFGTGYASLSHLKALPVHCLKIDRSFVMGVADSDNDRSIVAAVLGLAQALDLRAVAEGVETKDQEQALLGMGCEVFQGFLYAKPHPASEFPSVAGYLPRQRSEAAPLH